VQIQFFTDFATIRGPPGHGRHDAGWESHPRGAGASADAEHFAQNLIKAVRGVAGIGKDSILWSVFWWEAVGGGG
jgi:hypothetical protein